MEVLQRYAKLPRVVSDLRRAYELTRRSASHRRSTPTPLSQPKAVRRRLGEDALKRMEQDYQAGATARQLAAKYGIAKTSVQRHLHEAGVPLRRQAMTPEQIDQAARLYGAGLSLAVVGAVLGVDGSTVYRSFVAQGLPVRSKSYRS